MDWLKQLQKPNYWLLALTATVAALHLTLLDLDGDQNLLSLSILLWLGVGSLLWDKRHDLKLDSDIFSTIIGILLMGIVLLRSMSPSGYQFFTSPFLSAVAVCLMASGVRQLHQYWKELSILGLLVLYPVFAAILTTIKLPILTAEFSTFALWVSGFDAYREGPFIELPTGKVEVLNSCAGTEVLILMISLAILFCLLFPVKKIDWLICLITAPIIGFIVNSLRIGLLALLVAYSDKETFNYWHGEDGSLVFSMISVVVFGLFCWFFYVRKIMGQTEIVTDPEALNED